MNFESHHCILVMGTRGCGKSTLAVNLQKLFPRKVIIDTLGEYDDEQNTVYGFNEFADRLNQVRQNSEYKIIYQFNPENKNSEVEFDHVMRLCFYSGNLQIVLEEVQEHSSVHSLPHWLRQCLLKGRHQNVSVLSTTQRPGELNKTILSQSQHIFCGQIIEGNDLRYVAGFLRQSAEKLVQLPKGQFLYFTTQGVVQISNLF